METKKSNDRKPGLILVHVRTVAAGGRDRALAPGAAAGVAAMTDAVVVKAPILTARAAARRRAADRGQLNWNFNQIVVALMGLFNLQIWQP